MQWFACYNNSVGQSPYEQLTVARSVKKSVASDRTRRLIPLVTSHESVLSHISHTIFTEDTFGLYSFSKILGTSFDVTIFSVKIQMIKIIIT
jgi:hypothetical protein